MPGADLVPIPVVWTDNVDNWRAADADYLQKRAVMRFASVGNRTTALTATPVAGYLTYISDTLQYTDSASAAANVWRTVLAPKYLAISDTISSFGLRLASDGAASLALEAGTVVLGPSGALKVDTALRIKTGTKTAVLTTDATSLVSDSPISAPSGAISGALATATITNSGAITTASVVASGNLQSASLNVSGTSTLGVVNSGVLSATGAISATTSVTGATVVGNTSTDGGNMRVIGDTLINKVSTGGVVTVTANVVAAGTQVVLAPSGGPARFGTTGGPYLACSVASASDPGVANYPEGTIWAQV